MVPVLTPFPFFLELCLFFLEGSIFFTVHFTLICQTLFGGSIFYYLFFRTETFMMCVNVFYTTRNEISAGSDKRQRVSPQTPIIKISHICNVMVMSIDMTLQMWEFFIMGVYGEISQFQSDQAEISFLSTYMYMCI